jgi:SAM-dependent methyltransferase
VKILRAAADANELSNQVYVGAKASGYEFGQTECDATVYAWARGKVQALSKGRDVADIGCGKGQLLPAMDEARLLVGIDASADMVRDIPDVAGRTKAGWPLEPQALATLLREQRQLIFCGHMEEILPALGVQFDLALSAFNIVCFEDVAFPLESMHRCLRPGGRLVAISNIWVPREVAPEAGNYAAARAIELRSAARAFPDDLATGLRFRLVLALRSPQGDLYAYPLLDHVHTLGAYARALDPARWQVEEMLLYPPEGCTVVDPEVPSPCSDLYSGSMEHDVHSPRRDPRFSFAKLCLVAVKR